MKVAFRQTGGFAGTFRGCDLDDTSLPPAEARDLRRLVATSGVHAARSAGPSAARDLVQYEIVIENSGGIHSVAFDDMTIPAGIGPLLTYLQLRTKPIAPPG